MSYFACIICVAFAVSLIPTVSSQAIPELPELPSPSPAPTPSPLPSALAQIVHPSPSISPNSEPTAIPPNPLASPSFVPTSDPTAVNTEKHSQSPTPSLSASPSPIPSPSPSPENPFIQPDGRCMRDKSIPRPRLGKSQARYAISVLLSAAAVATASLLYGFASDWRPNEEKSGWRLAAIILARVLITGSVRVSAALVASITRASPDDGALDASGAFLTWGTSIFTRLYYEGFKMTMAVLGFAENDAVWDDKLKSFLSVSRVVKYKKESYTENNNDNDDVYKNEKEHLRPYVEYVNQELTFHQYIFGGNLERKLLTITALLYFASEITVLVTNVEDLLGAFDTQRENAVFFSSDDLGGQCPLSSRDAPLLIGIILIQIIHTLTQQPSLVPLLTVTAFCPNCGNAAINRIIKKLRWIATIVLFLWVSSLLIMPVFLTQLEPYFTVGDLSLFWYIIVAPPAYNATNYIVTATFTCFAAAVGVYIILGLVRSEGMEEVGSPSV